MADGIEVTVLDENLKQVFQGTEDDAYDWVMEHPLEATSVWFSDSYVPISIDEWMQLLDELED